MTPSASVVIPVKDGARWLAATLAAVAGQADGDVEVLVVDSGSSDGSAAIARDAGARVLRVAPHEFGHGRTRNLAADQTDGELLCFLTQDAEPCPGWLGAFRELMESHPDVGAAFGPHLPRPDTSPMIARELRDFFAGFAGPENGIARVFPRGDAPFLSNVNACYRRACWSELRFQDVAFAEDRAFARELAGTEWLLAYHPGAAVMHAHDFGPVTFIRRYFDEYAGLRAVEGYVEPLGFRSKWPEVRDQVARDRQWMRDRGIRGPAFTAWSARSLFHHATRKAAMVAGTHPERIPAPVARAISLDGGPSLDGASVPRVVPARGTSPWEPVLALGRGETAPLVGPVPGMANAGQMHVAVVIPPFTVGSGGHSTIYRLLGPLEERGHTVTTWVHDPESRMAGKWPAVIRADLQEMAGAPRGPVFKGFGAWFGADVVLATGWDTAYRVMGLPDCRARAYLVQDDEARFFPASAQAVWADASYELDLDAVVVSPWLAEIVEQRTGVRPPVVELGVDGAVYRPHDVRRRADTVIFYARDATPRRAVPLGILALAELHRRRPHTRFVLFGGTSPVAAPFDYDHVGVTSPAELARHYAQATVGLCLSLTNHSLVPHEMLACGLPCVELAGGSLERMHGRDGPIAFAQADPLSIAGALERLLEDADEHARRSRAGIAAVAGHDWNAASVQLEAALRDALRARETLAG
jgi:glycosyltransferase involved in cell wall biosynthesis